MTVTIVNPFEAGRPIKGEIDASFFCEGSRGRRRPTLYLLSGRVHMRFGEKEKD